MVRGQDPGHSSELGTRTGEDQILSSKLGKRAVEDQILSSELGKLPIPPGLKSVHWSHLGAFFRAISHASSKPCVKTRKRSRPRPIVVDPGGPPDDLPW
jgi:hypothetical protein